MPASGEDTPKSSRAGGLARHAALVPLSREHHGVLVQALALKRAAAASVSADDVAAAVAAYLRFHDDEMIGHMGDEESVLLPAAAAVDPQGAERILAEHRRIEALTSALRSAKAASGYKRETLRVLGELLDAHVRFEERVYFMRVQERLGADELTALGAALERRRSERGCSAACSLPTRR